MTLRTALSVIGRSGRQGVPDDWHGSAEGPPLRQQVEDPDNLEHVALLVRESCGLTDRGVNLGEPGRVTAAGTRGRGDEEVVEPVKPNRRQGVAEVFRFRGTPRPSGAPGLSGS